MLFKLAALGALGFAGYKRYEKSRNGSRMRSRSQPALAGGPLSSEARVQHTPDAPNG